MNIMSMRNCVPIAAPLFSIVLAGIAFSGPTHELVYGFSQTTQNPDGDGPLASLVSDGQAISGEQAAGRREQFRNGLQDQSGNRSIHQGGGFHQYGTTNRGSQPLCKLLPDGAGFLWGTTYYGAANGTGTIFKININTGQLTTLLEFDARSPNTGRGSHPHAGLVNDGSGNLWGTAHYGGASDIGTVFKFNMNTNTMTRIVSFTGATGNKGYWPLSRLADDGAGYFWGTTAYTSGGVASGTVFKVNQNTGEFKSVFLFSNAAAGGYYLRAELVDDGSGNMWSTTYWGGTSGKGTAFKINKATEALTTVANFTIGSNTVAGLVSDDSGNFWGTTLRRAEWCRNHLQNQPQHECADNGFGYGQ